MDDGPMNCGRPRTIAFHLPQFHQIPENDAWWGEGFTDWVNVQKAQPMFDGHLHPRRPADLGYYDLGNIEAMRQQASLARDADIDAFCFYFYWFDGQRLLERPIEQYDRSDIDFPYCLSWANEAWTRRWDGKHRDVLMPQSYDQGFAEALFADLLPHLRNPVYLTMRGLPILLVHRVDEIPDPPSVVVAWRRCAANAGLPGLYLIAAETKPDLDPRRFGFDAVAEFPPVGSNTFASALTRAPKRLSPEFRGRLLSYDRMAARFRARSRPAFIRHRGVTPGWDNTARRRSKATVYVGSSPRGYAEWLAAARAEEEDQRGCEGLVFINAWNEWAEGAYLEPDEASGHAYLEATKWKAEAAQLAGAPEQPAGRWSGPFIRSLLLLALGSVLSCARRLRARIGGGRSVEVSHLVDHGEPVGKELFGGDRFDEPPSG